MVSMEHQQPHMPGYRIQEYALVLNPHEDMRNRIGKIRDEFSERFKTPVSRYLKPNITLVTFQTWVMMEEKIMQRLQGICHGCCSFQSRTKGLWELSFTHNFYQCEFKTAGAASCFAVEGSTAFDEIEPGEQASFHRRTAHHHCKKTKTMAV